MLDYILKFEFWKSKFYLNIEKTSTFLVYNFK